MGGGHSTKSGQRSKRNHKQEDEEAKNYWHPNPQKNFQVDTPVLAMMPAWSSHDLEESSNMKELVKSLAE